MPGSSGIHYGTEWGGDWTPGGTHWYYVDFDAASSGSATIHMHVQILINAADGDSKQWRKFAGNPDYVTRSQSRILARDFLAVGSELLRHELGHTLQAAQMGERFGNQYAQLAGDTASALASTGVSTAGPSADDIHTFHPMEIDANQRAGFAWDYRPTL